MPAPGVQKAGGPPLPADHRATPKVRKRLCRTTVPRQVVADKVAGGGGRAPETIRTSSFRCSRRYLRASAASGRRESDPHSRSLVNLPLTHRHISVGNQAKALGFLSSRKFAPSCPREAERGKQDLWGDSDFHSVGTARPFRFLVSCECRARRLTLNSRSARWGLWAISLRVDRVHLPIIQNSRTPRIEWSDETTRNTTAQMCWVAHSILRCHKPQLKGKGWPDKANSASSLGTFLSLSVSAGDATACTPARARGHSRWATQSPPPP